MKNNVCPQPEKEIQVLINLNEALRGSVEIAEQCESPTVKEKYLILCAKIAKITSLIRGK